VNKMDLTITLLTGISHPIKNKTAEEFINEITENKTDFILLTKGVYINKNNIMEIKETKKTNGNGMCDENTNDSLT
jgi:hypothetical protein